MGGRAKAYQVFANEQEAHGRRIRGQMDKNYEVVKSMHKINPYFLERKTYAKFTILIL